MNKNLTVIFLICSLLLTACNASGTAIIGGADGPTSIYVNSRFGKQFEKKPVRMFNIDGELYYDTGLVSDVNPRCGVMDGSIKKSVKENEIPLKTGEANFDAKGYQSGTSITKEVLIDGEWVIFKKFDTYGQMLDGLKYCHYIKGRLNNAENDSEIIVLSEDEGITFNDVYAPLLSSQLTEGAGRGKTIHNPMLNDKWGICFYADDVTKTGMTLKIEQLGGEYSGSLQTGAEYILETIAGDEWQEVETISGMPLAWNSLAYMIKKNDITEMKIDWQYAFGELKPGVYRIKKEVMDFNGAGNSETQTYEVSFTIE